MITNKTIVDALKDLLGKIKGVSADTITAETIAELIQLISDNYSNSGQEIAQATDNKLGGIKAVTKGSGDTVEVKIETATGKLFVPTYPAIYSLPEASTSNLGGVKKAAKVDAVASPNADNAVGANPTQAEFNKVVTLVNDLKNTLNSVIANEKTAKQMSDK